MCDRLVPFAALQELCSPDGPPPRANTVRRWAERQGIRYRYDRRGGIWTTLDAVNAALGLSVALEERAREEDNI